MKLNIFSISKNEFTYIMLATKMISRVIQRIAGVQKSISTSFVYRVYGAVDSMKHLFTLCLPVALTQTS